MCPWPFISLCFCTNSRVWWRREKNEAQRGRVSVHTWFFRCPPLGSSTMTQPVGVIMPPDGMTALWCLACSFLPGKQRYLSPSV